MLDRVCFFSREDLSVRHYLEVAEKRIFEVSKKIPSDIVGVVELWHIKCLFDNNCRLLKWSDVEYENLKVCTNEYGVIIANFFNTINPKKIKIEFERLDWTYKTTFWEIIDAYKLYKLIEPDMLREIISENINYFRSVLAHKGVVERFKNVIREELLNNINSAHIVLDRYVMKRELNGNSNFHLPSNVTLEDKEQILINYLQSAEPNLNYVRLITQIKNDKNQIIISPKTKLLAERVAKRLNDEMLSDPNTVTTCFSVGVQFIDEDIEPIRVQVDENGLPKFYTYSIPYVRQCNHLKRVGNCISLFRWLNKHFQIDLVNKKTEVDLIESLLIDKGKDAYPAYSIFNHKNDLSQGQLKLYDEVLKKNGSSFEYELKLFYEQYLKDEYDYPSLSINFPNPEDSMLNKCRILCPELDSIVKQYDIFVEEGEIDKDLIRLSKPIRIEDAKSMLVNKYYELVEDNNEIKLVLRNLLGYENASLSYVEPFKNKKYHSLAELLENENKVLYSNYTSYQKIQLDFLIQQGIIGINTDGYIYIINQSTLKILKNLWEYGVCAYWHYNTEEREILDDMLKKGWLITDDHLLSKPERDYFSYYLDNMKYTNGFAYRNHYMHGSLFHVKDEREHFVAYITFLRLLAILLLKIEDDLWVARRALAIYETFRIKQGK